MHGNEVLVESTIQGKFVVDSLLPICVADTLVAKRLYLAVCLSQAQQQLQMRSLPFHLLVTQTQRDILHCRVCCQCRYKEVETL